MASVRQTFLLFLLSSLLASSVYAGPDDAAAPGDDAAAPGDGANPQPMDGGSDYTMPPIETEFLGEWAIDNPNAGVAAMQLQLMPNDKVIWYDTTSLGPSGIKMQPEGNCPINPDANNQPDCFAHAIAYDWKTAQVRTLTLQGDAWCSSGNLWPNGNLVATGGTFTGNKAVRMFPNNDDPNSDFDTRLNVLADGRWYSANQILPDGSAVVMGGRDSYSYEIVPPSLEFTPRRFDMPFLQQTTTPALGPGRPVENNLYPFVFLLPDGNVFLYANNRAITFEPNTGNVVAEHPECPGGGARNYPPSGMAALLPLKLTPDNQAMNVEVVVCGGNLPDAYQVVDARHVTEKEFMPALQDCYRIHPLMPDAAWEKEQDMPSPRTMGDLLHLPNANLLMLNGARKGTSGWEDSTDANFVPALYTPFKPMGERFKELTPTNIARMYHSCSALLPDTKILVAGSNPHQFYTFDVEFPTELRVEKFTPPYLDPALDAERPIIDPAGSDVVLQYGQPFKIAATMTSNEVLALGENIITMVYPPFTTHGFSQNQRLIMPAITGIENNVITAVAPANGMIAPPGYYMLFVSHLGVPSQGIWVNIN
ncbi:aldehyde oxidase GLOX1-like [Cynara cardunculus var. scolymus]|uniref:aldehyde oxidase GLOX1-like n=1 Tax=Cynara cardunculus var. scolymus TaxID=59895 RepID=UPI000D62B571|nr:aldehyde oxidase GLOX1-like [Cynara cardunculus var. scolymus]